MYSVAESTAHPRCERRNYAPSGVILESEGRSKIEHFIFLVTVHQNKNREIYLCKIESQNPAKNVCLKFGTKVLRPDKSINKTANTTYLTSLTLGL